MFSAVGIHICSEQPKFPVRTDDERDEANFVIDWRDRDANFEMSLRSDDDRRLSAGGDARCKHHPTRQRMQRER